MNQARNVAILIYDNVEPLDFVGPFEVFISSSNYGKDFNVYTVAEKDEPVSAIGGLSINPSYTIHTCPKPDILVVPGGWGSRTAMLNENLTNWIREASDEVEVLLSVCTGALILAKANLLDGLKVTTNRSAINTLQELIPVSTEIIPDARYVDNGKIVLSAGVSAGMDAALYVVSRLLGEDRAVHAATLMEYDWNRMPN
ncbi:DJ-1/PfpI family protein [Paenibacillus sp. N1-5-1-14]|uniref:DJ-1/PfpI family protein n=1 Tax=Paenibacillus radicibacter TaxID=2972488 RepID=UPI002158DA75|nr:DJ-1/PfpI family protein [Paenibacillus radicibacter]MCR8643290.1 DJ-1/PfpI family protein [Paenibacillus radicibacter]